MRNEDEISDSFFAYRCSHTSGNTPCYSVIKMISLRMPGLLLYLDESRLPASIFLPSCMHWKISSAALLRYSLCYSPSYSVIEVEVLGNKDKNGAYKSAPHAKTGYLYIWYVQETSSDSFTNCKSRYPRSWPQRSIRPIQ